MIDLAVLRHNMRRNAFFLSNAMIASILVFVLVETFCLRIFYSITFLVSTFLLQSYLFGPEKRCIARIPRAPLMKLIPYILGLASMIVILASPPKYSVTVSWLAFASLTPLSVLRVISGYFLLSVFPGYAVCRVLLKDKDLGVLEKTTLIIGMSYVASIILGLSIRFAGFELTTASLVVAIWLFTLGIEAVGHVLLKRKTRRVKAIGYPFSEHKTSLLHRTPLEYNPKEIALLATTVICLLFSSYFIVLSSEPTDFALAYDIARYEDIASRFLLNRPIDATYGSYIWLQFYIAEASLLTGLHSTYAYVGLQYLIVLIPLSIYVLLKTLFPRTDKAPVIGAVLISVLPGLGAIGMYDFYSQYNQGGLNVWHALYGVSAKLGLGGFHMLLASTIGLAMSTLYSAYAYKYLAYQRKSDLILSSFLAVAALFSHNIFFPVCFFVAVTIYALIFRRLKAVMKMVLLMVTIFISMDILSELFFINQFINYSLHATIFFLRQRYVLLTAEAFLAVAGSGLLLYIVCRLLRKAPIGLRLLKLNFISQRKAKVILWILSFAVLAVAVSGWRIQYSEINTFWAIYDPMYFTTPYLYVLRSYGIYLLITLVSLGALVVQPNKRALIFLFGLTVSTVFLALLGLAAPDMLPPNVWTNRFLGFASLPLACLATIGLCYVGSQSPMATARVKHTGKPSKITGSSGLRRVGIFLMILLSSVSFLSYVYTIEFYSAGSYAYGNLSAPEVDVYEWIHHNLPRDSLILTLSYYPSYLRLASMTSRAAISYLQPDPKVIHNGLPIRIMSDSCRPEVLLYSLKELGITHILLTDYDVNLINSAIEEPSFLFLLDAFPVLHRNEYAILYTVPNALYSDSNYVLVEPTLDFASGDQTMEKNTMASYQTAFSMLVASNLSFSVVPDVELDELKEHNVYVFPSNWHLTDDLRENFIDHISHGANAIIVDPGFASFDELSSPRESGPLDGLDVKVGEAIYSSSLTFRDGFQLDFAEVITVPAIPADEPNLKILANYTLNGESQSPFALQKDIENGSMSFINIRPLIESEILKNIDQRKLFTHTTQMLMENLPKPNTPVSSLTLPYPSDLYKLLSPTLLNIHNLQGLNGYLFNCDNLDMNGSCTFKSNYVLWETEEIQVEKVVLENGTSYRVFENETLSDLMVKGYANVTLETMNATVWNNPTGLLTSVSLTSPFHVQLVLDRAEVSFTLGGNGQLFDLTQGRITMVIPNTLKSLNVGLRQPTISLDGTLHTKWQGAMWHEGTLYTPVASPQHFPIEGNLTLEILFCSGTILAKIHNIQDIRVIVLTG